MRTVAVSRTWNLTRATYLVPIQLFQIKQPGLIAILKFIIASEVMTSKYYQFSISLIPN